jgi:hypothetical protein
MPYKVGHIVVTASGAWSSAGVSVILRKSFATDVIPKLERTREASSLPEKNVRPYLIYTVTFWKFPQIQGLFHDKIFRKCGTTQTGTPGWFVCLLPTLVGGSDMVSLVFLSRSEFCPPPLFTLHLIQLCRLSFLSFFLSLPFLTFLPSLLHSSLRRMLSWFTNNGKDTEGNDPDLIWGTIPAFVWRDWGKRPTTSDGI